MSCAIEETYGAVNNTFGEFFWVWSNDKKTFVSSGFELLSIQKEMFIGNDSWLAGLALQSAESKCTIGGGIRGGIRVLKQQFELLR
jgi:hypothetical protein